MQAQDLVKRVSALDPALGKDLQNYLGTRRLGLVWEESKPEYVRLWNKPVIEGDLVNILPPRGEAENLNDDSDEHDAIWRVAKITGGTARLVGFEGDAMCDAAVDDLVAVARFDQRIYCGLKETGRVERGGDKPCQTVINGENFHAIESLLFAYRGKVDCIYIDPPYNTGAKDWKYNNNYVGSDDRYRHSKWLTFMEDRLKVAKALLNPENSVLICTIDEKEYARLELLLEKLFPTSSGIQTVSVTINKNGVARGNQFKRADEYAIFVFFGEATPCPVPQHLYSVEFEKVAGDAGNSRSQRKVRWEWLLRGGSNSARSDRPNLFYPIYIDEESMTIQELGDSVPLDFDKDLLPTKKGLRAIWPIRPDGQEATWHMSQVTLQKKIDKGFARVSTYDKKNDRYTLLYLANIQEDRLEQGELVITGHRPDGSAVVEYAKDADASVVPTTVWTGAQFSAGEYGSRYIKRFLGQRSFSFPKSLYATELALATVVADKPDALIVDFFAGSGTTAHAVMRLNHQDGGRRRCICVTNNEVSADEQKELVAKGLRQGDAEWERLGICEYVTKPRVTAAIMGETPDGETIKGDYKFTDEFPMADGFEENAVYYDLTYLEPAAVSADLAFDEIAPLLWLRAGSVGPVINHGDSYELTDAYGVLFDTDYAAPFIRACGERHVPLAFVVTDVDADYRALVRDLPGTEVVQLYKQYLRSFEIGAGL